MGATAEDINPLWNTLPAGFTWTIDTTTTWGHIHFFPLSFLVGASWQGRNWWHHHLRHRDIYLFFCVRRPKFSLFGLDSFFQLKFSVKTFNQSQASFPPSSCVDGKSVHLNVTWSTVLCCLGPLHRWRRSAVAAHSLWNSSCADCSFRSPVQPKYHVPKMGNAECMQNFEQWQVSGVLVSIFYSNMPTGYHNKRNRPLMTFPFCFCFFNQAAEKR